MATITQVYKVSNWMNYERAESLGDTSGLNKKVVHTIMGNRQAKVTSFLSDSEAEGWEVRELTIDDAEL